MPIYEFKCLKCEDIFEMLFKSNQDVIEVKCPKCASEDFERVLSSSNFSLSGKSNATSTTTGMKSRSCSSGSCATYDIPGPA